MSNGRQLIVEARRDGYRKGVYTPVEPRRGGTGYRFDVYFFDDLDEAKEFAKLVMRNGSDYGVRDIISCRVCEVRYTPVFYARKQKDDGDE